MWPSYSVSMVFRATRSGICLVALINLWVQFYRHDYTNVVVVYTNFDFYLLQVYPTSSRSTGLGIANAIAKVGGLLCPLVAVDLVRSCQQGLAVSLFVAVPLVAGIAVLFFPVETKGRPLSDRVEHDAQVKR